MKDWSQPEVERVFAALSDWREQFTEHKNKVGTRLKIRKGQTQKGVGGGWHGVRGRVWGVGGHFVFLV